MDVNVERAEDVLTHKRLLHLARDPANRPAFEVRLVQVHCYSTDSRDSLYMLRYFVLNCLFLVY